MRIGAVALLVLGEPCKSVEVHMGVPHDLGIQVSIPALVERNGIAVPRNAVQQSRANKIASLAVLKFEVIVDLLRMRC
jgi:hypothetical protein